MYKHADIAKWNISQLVKQFKNMGLDPDVIRAALIQGAENV